MSSPSYGCIAGQLNDASVFLSLMQLSIGRTVRRDAGGGATASGCCAAGGGGFASRCNVTALQRNVHSHPLHGPQLPHHHRKGVGVGLQQESTQACLSLKSCHWLAYSSRAAAAGGSAGAHARTVTPAWDRMQASERSCMPACRRAAAHLQAGLQRRRWAAAYLAGDELGRTQHLGCHPGHHSGGSDAGRCRAHHRHL